MWNKSCFGCTQSRIKELEEKIKSIQDAAPTKENIELEASLNLELNDWLKTEELKWHQKSRELWLKESDKNSKFFYLSTLVHKRINLISEIQLDNRSWVHSREEISSYFLGKFVEVFTSSSPLDPIGLEELFTLCISESENANLSRILDFLEIKDAIWEMHPLKAPGPDGLPDLFFKEYSG
jgi:predicted XRE-type DNA-binding protein